MRPAPQPGRLKWRFGPSIVYLLVGLVLSLPGVRGQDRNEIKVIARGQETSPTEEPQEQQESPNDPARVLRQRIEGINVQLPDSDLPEADRQQVQTLLAQALKELDLYERLKQENADFRQQADRLADSAEQLRTPPKLEAAPNAEEMSVDDLEKEVATEKVRLQSAEQALEQDRKNRDETADVRQKAVERVATTEEEVSSATQRADQLPAEPAGLSDAAAGLEAQAFRLKAEADYDLARTALALLDARIALKLPSLRVAWQEEVVRLHTERLQALTAQLDARRQQSSRQELERARQAEDQLESIENEDIKDLGKLRLELATENTRLAERDLPYWRPRLKLRREELQLLKEKSRTIQGRVQKYGTNTTLGRELLRFGAELPSAVDLRNEMHQIDQLTANWMERSLEFARASQDIETVSEETRDTATEAEVEILDGVAQILGQLEDNYNQLFEVLTDLNAEDQATISFMEDWQAFSREHALWLRSHEPLEGRHITEAIPAIREESANLLASLRNMASGARLSVWALILPAGLAILVLLAVQSQAKNRLLKHGETASQGSCMSMRPTMLAVMLSVGLAAEWPLILMLIGSVLQAQPGDAALALGRSLIQLGGIGLWLNFFRQVFRPGGLASSHLKWNPVICDRLRRWLRLVLVVVSLPMFLFLFARNIVDETDTLDRVLFLVLMVCSTLVLTRLLLPTTNHFVQEIASRSSLLKSTRLLWIAVMLVTPLCLAGLAASGYYHSALVIWDRLGWSVVSATGIILVWSLILRWLRMNHRAMRMALARERAQQRDQPDEVSEVDLAAPPPTQDSELIVFGTQARQLIRNAAILVSIGCAWVIWFDTLPALRVLERQTVWSVTEQVTVEETSESGETTQSVRTQKRPVTIISLLLVVFVGSATYIGVRQLPGLIEVILLRRKQFDAGLRYTITTVIRYLILVAGCMICFGLLGLRWSQVQWLVAGLSVGLGFGLQEVFANFVSGIIILVERPIRIGDVVTIDGVSGVVSRIQIRATSITDWDRREYIVPNRELVTGKLLNWTLSDSTNRVMITVGIGYGCDPEKARTTMLKVASEHPNVMDDPGPMATFESFGDSSLNLVLRAYLPDMDNRLGTITELHTNIHKAFAEEGIDIPFPQREVRML